MASELNIMQKRFAQEYVLDWNATQAAIRAGYAKKTAAQQGSRLLSNVKIQAFIKKCQADTARIAGVSHLMIVLELKKIAFSNIADIYEDWETWKGFDKLTEAQRAAISEINWTHNETKYGSSEVKKLKMHDKVRALENLSKQLGFDAPMKIDHTTGGEQISDTIVMISPKVEPKSVQNEEG